MEHMSSVMGVQIVHDNDKNGWDKNQDRNMAIAGTRARIRDNMCEREPWSSAFRLCLIGAKSREKLRGCGDAAKQAEVALDEAARYRVKGVKGGSQYDTETGRWGHRDENGNWVDEGTH
jgi:hypothetical protein